MNACTRFAAALISAGVLALACGEAPTSDSRPAVPAGRPEQPAAPDSAPAFSPSYSGAILAAPGSLDEPVGKPGELWRTRTGVPIVGSVAVVRGTAVVGCADYSVRGLSLDDGEVIWTSELSMLPVCIAPWTEAVVVSGPGGTAGLSGSTGEILWTVEDGVAPGSSILMTSRAGYMATHSGQMTSFDPATGEVIWSVDPDPGSDAPAAGSPGALEGVLFAGFADGTVAAIEAESGSYRWTVSLGAAIASGPAIRADGVSVPTMDGTIVTLSRDDGASLSIAELSGIITSQGIPVEPEIVWLGIDADLHVLSSDSLRSIPLPIAGLAAQPTLYDSVILVPDTTGSMHAVDPVSGEVRWSTLLGFEVHGGFARSQQTVVAAGVNGAVAAFTLTMPVDDVPVIGSAEITRVPADGVFRMKDRSVDFRVEIDSGAVIEWSIASDDADLEVVMSLLDASGRVITDNMGKVELSDRIRAALDPGTYLLRLELLFANAAATFALSSETID